VRSRGAVVTILLIAAGCRGERPDDVIVLAAASLTEPFGEIAAAYEREHPGAEVTLEFAASSTLAAQIRAGASFDVLATADERTMARVWQAGLVTPPAGLASNRLVVIVPGGNPGGVRGIEDLARPEVTVVLAQEDVPAGAYARRALSALGIITTVEANVVSNALDVKAVAAAVALGEADAGIVYATDVTPDLRARVRVFPLPDRVDVRVVYPIATASESRHPEGARAFTELVGSGAGRAILAAHGFGPP
jgi:molybdate transport system substrate-binding protein